MTVPTAYAEWGKLLVETDVDRAVIAALMTWMPTYLTQAERERGLTPHLLARPTNESYTNALEDDEFPDGRLPAMVVTTARTEDNPDSFDIRRYAAAWRVNVSAVIRGRTPPETREVAALFGGCVRRILIQQQINLDGEVRWRSSLVTPYPDATEQGRYLAAAVNGFTVFADDVLSGDGPVIPDEHDPDYPPPDPSQPDQPYDPLAEVRSVTTQIVARS
jgi:hypothetical protein